MGVDFEVSVGLARTVGRQLRNRDTGDPFTDADTPFLSSDTLAFVAWPGDDVATVVSLTPTWDDADTGSYSIPFAAATTSSLSPGIYQWSTRLTRSGSTGEVDRGSFRLLPSPGTGTTPLAFTVQDDLRTLAPWLDEFLTSADQANFAEVQHRATVRLIEALVSLAPVQQGSAGLLDRTWYGAGAVDGGAGNYLRQQLMPLEPDSTADADLYPDRLTTEANLIQPRVSTALLLYSAVIEVCANWAVAAICRRQLGPSPDSSRSWRDLAARFASEGNSLFATTRFEIDLAVPMTGKPSLVIHGGCGALR